MILLNELIEKWLYCLQIWKITHKVEALHLIGHKFHISKSSCQQPIWKCFRSSLNFSAPKLDFCPRKLEKNKMRKMNYKISPNRIRFSASFPIEGRAIRILSQYFFACNIRLFFRLLRSMKYHSMLIAMLSVFISLTSAYVFFESALAVHFPSYTVDSPPSSHVYPVSEMYLLFTKYVR